MFLVLKGLGVLAQIVMVIHMLIHLIGGDVMNMWTAIVCIVGLVLLLICAILIYNYLIKKLEKKYEDRDAEREATERLNNKLIKNNKIKSNCDPISYSSDIRKSAAPQNVSNLDSDMKNVIDMAHAVAKMTNKME